MGKPAVFCRGHKVFLAVYAVLNVGSLIVVWIAGSAASALGEGLLWWGALVAAVYALLELLDAISRADIRSNGYIPGYMMPWTYYMRACNRQVTAQSEARLHTNKASECRELAKTYRNRNEPYQAEILEAQADANERTAAMREEDAKRIQRELEDRKMRELTR